nr:winged helix-turn-helix domain-containing protein [Lysobacter sp. CAU 1642]
MPRRLVDLLACLASRPGETFSREALLEAVWARKVVGDEVLSRAIAELRGLLGDDARSPRYIETLPKTGYRLLVPVMRMAGEADAIATRDPAAPVEVSELTADTSTPPPAASGRLAGVIVGLLLVSVLIALAGWWAWSGKEGQTSATPESTGWTAADLVREHPFRSGPHWGWQPRYSRDGRWLAYAINDLETGESWLEWATADGSAPRRIEGGVGRLAAPVFSPDGTRLAFTAWDGSDCTLRVVDLPAGLPRDLGPCGGSQSYPLDWPREDRLLYTGPSGDEAGPAALWRTDPSTGQSARLTTPPPTALYDSHPRQNAAGDIAFLRGPHGQRELWLRQGDSERRLLPGAHRIPDLAWTADGRALIVASDRDGFPALHWLNPVTGELRLLGGRGAATLDIGPDGSLLYERRRYDANLWRYSEGGEPERVTDSTRYEAFAAPSPDGDALVYVSNRDGNGSVWWQRGATEHRLSLPDAEAWVRPQWLDARHLLLTRYVAGGQTRIEVFDLAGQRLLDAHPLAGPGFAAQPLGGERILYARGHGDSAGMRLWLRDATGERELGAARAVADFHAGDGWIAWESRGDTHWQLLQVDALDEPPQRLPLPATLGAWGLHAGRLVYAAREGESWALFLQPLDGSPASRWLELRGAPADGRVVVDSEGTHAILSHVDAFSTDLMRVPPAPRGVSPD